MHSLVLPMVMLCLHKHSLGACSAHHEDFDPHAFIRLHIDLVIRGLLRHRAEAQQPRRAAARAEAPVKFAFRVTRPPTADA